MKKITLMMLLIFASMPLFAQTLYIQAKQAKLLQEPRFKSAVVTTLKQGDAVALLSKKGRWMQVLYGEQQGWLPSLLLAAKPPMEKGQTIKYQEHSIAENARRRASSSNSVAATRGLTDDGTQGEADSSDSDFEALEKMKSMSVSDEEVQQFQEQGE